MIASLQQCFGVCPDRLKTQATVLITESSTYQDLENLIERWDSSQTR